MPVPLLNAAVVLLTLAALGGMVMAGLIFKEKPLPWMLTIGHGVLAATGVVCLAIVAFGESGSLGLMWAFALFVIGALGGLYLVSLHLREKPHPRGLVAGHGLIAVVGYLILLVSAYG